MTEVRTFIPELSKKPFPVEGKLRYNMGINIVAISPQLKTPRFVLVTRGAVSLVTEGVRFYE